MLRKHGRSMLLISKRLLTTRKVLSTVVHARPAIPPPLRFRRLRKDRPDIHARVLAGGGSRRRWGSRNESHFGIRFFDGDRRRRPAHILTARITKQSIATLAQMRRVVGKTRIKTMHRLRWLAQMRHAPNFQASRRRSLRI